MFNVTLNTKHVEVLVSRHLSGAFVISVTTLVYYHVIYLSYLGNTTNPPNGKHTHFHNFILTLLIRCVAHKNQKNIMFYAVYASPIDLTVF